jgi:thiamine biosynthesis lipoprotein
LETLLGPARRCRLGLRRLAGRLLPCWSAVEALRMGTVVEMTAYGRGSAAAVRSAAAELARLESVFTAHSEASALGRLNAGAGGGPAAVSREVADLLAHAVAWARRSGGAFDPTIGPLAALWRTAIQNERPPEPGEVTAARALTGYGDLAVSPERNAATLRRPGQAVDLGGIAKGHAADRLIELLAGSGMTAALVNLGGNVKVLGRKPGASGPWRIGLLAPREPDTCYATLRLESGWSVVTSGDYEQYFEVDGRRYHHIVDPRTGYPCDSGPAGVTIVAQSSLAADALATAAMVLGLAGAVDLVRAAGDAQAVMVEAGGRIHATVGLKGKLETTQPGQPVHWI